MQDFDFENWDFLDPKIVNKFKKISEVSQMLLNQQESMKKAQFLSFKDKQNVQNNINKFKSSLASLLSSQKDHLIDYFDKQVDTVSKRINVPQLSRTFQQSLRTENSSRASLRKSIRIQQKGRRYSEGDLSRYLRERELKGKILNELQSSTTESQPQKSLDTSIMTRKDFAQEHSRLTEEGRGSLLDLNDLETRRESQSIKIIHPYKETKIGTDSIFSQELHNYDTHAESQFLQSKMKGLGEELELAKKELKVLRKFYNTHKLRELRNGVKKREKPLMKHFVRDKRNRSKYLKMKEERESNKNKENEKNYENLKMEHELEIEKMRQELEKSTTKSDRMRKEIKELGLIVIQNEELMEEMLNNKKEIEKEMKLSKELNSLLLENFSQFKGYVEKTFGGVSKKLAAYVEKEEYYTEIAKENEQLRQKCRSLLIKLKEVAQY